MRRTNTKTLIAVLRLVSGDAKPGDGSQWAISESANRLEEFRHAVSLIYELHDLGVLQTIKPHQSGAIEHLKDLCE